MSFFKYSADKLGSTKYVFPNAVLGLRGEQQKMLDLTVDDKEASAVLLSIRAEYSSLQATVSNTISSPVPIIGATNAAPIAITTIVAHSLVTGQSVTISGVRGNLAANITTTVTVTGVATFTLDGSSGIGAGVYTGGGQVVATSLGGTGSGIWTVGGPLVGLLQWGVGGGQNQIEFDIPSARLPDHIAPIAAAMGTGTPNNVPMTNTGRGVLIHLGGSSHISLYARSDGSMCPLNNPGVGPGTDTIGNNAPAKILAFVAPSDGAGTVPLQRSIQAVGGNAGSPLAPAAAVFVTIPPFATSLRFERIPAASPILLTFFTNNAVAYREVNLAVNSEGPIPLNGILDYFSITNVGAAAINRITAVFDVTP